MKMVKYLLSILLFSVLMTKISCGEITHIAFEPPTIEEGQTIISDWSENGMIFTGSNGFIHCDSNPLWGYDPVGDSAYLKFLIRPEQPMIFKSTNDMRFELYSVDLAEYSIYEHGNSKSVTFIGHKNDGSIVTQIFALDGLIDRAGPIDDFETFVFKDNFTNLCYVEIPTLGYSLDNLYLSIIPEPSTILFIITGIGFVTRRVQKLIQR
jgi:hypothetical protein